MLCSPLSFSPGSEYISRRESSLLSCLMQLGDRIPKRSQAARNNGRAPLGSPAYQSNNIIQDINYAKTERRSHGFRRRANSTWKFYPQSIHIRASYNFHSRWCCLRPREHCRIIIAAPGVWCTWRDFCKHIPRLWAWWYSQGWYSLLTFLRHRQT